MRRKAAIIGSSGFIGRGVVRALESRGIVAVGISAPRLVSHDIPQPERLIGRYAAIIDEVVRGTSGCSVVINAAGIADPGCRDRGMLTGANAVLPAVIATAAAHSNQRYIHVSSAAVQGRARMLDSSENRHPFSPYSESKALGEYLALRANPRTVIYRPAGVHSPDRLVTQRLAQIARSRAAAVACSGCNNTPQALLENVSDAVAFLAIVPQQPPSIVSHPSEGLSPSDLLRALGGGKEPRCLPRSLAVAVVALTAEFGRFSSRVGAISRRIETLWLGQGQAESWLECAGWRPVASRTRWAEIGRQLGRPVAFSHPSRGGKND